MCPEGSIRDAAQHSDCQLVILRRVASAYLGGDCTESWGDAKRKRNALEKTCTRIFAFSQPVAGKQPLIGIEDENLGRFRGGRNGGNSIGSVLVSSVSTRFGKTAIRLWRQTWQNGVVLGAIEKNTAFIRFVGSIWRRNGRFSETSCNRKIRNFRFFS